MENLIERGIIMKKGIKMLLPVLALLTVAAPVTFKNLQKISTVEAKYTVAATKVESTPLPVKSVKERLAKAVVLYVGSTQALVNNAEKQVDKDSADVKPIVKNDRTLVPVRFISENIGAQVTWDAGTQTVKVTLNGKEVVMVIGKTTMMVNGKEVPLDSSAEVLGGRTFIPLRQLTEALGKKVFYDRGLIVISDQENILNNKNEKGKIDEIIAKVNNLPVVGSFEKLKSIVASSSNNYDRKISKSVQTDAIQIDIAPSVAEKAPQSIVNTSEKSKAETTNGAGSYDLAGDDYSKTNVQVQGVDEADVVKTDGKYIYQVNKERIVIAKAYPADTMKVVGKLSFSDKKAVPLEIYIDGKYMSVIAQGTNNQYEIPEGKIQGDYDYYQPYKQTTKVFVYDITDKENIKSVRELEIEGNYISSRKIGAVLYLITNKNVYISDNSSEKDVTPCYRDSAAKDEYVNIDCKNIRYFPNSTLNNYMTIGAIDLNNISEEAKISTYLGAGQNIYSSTQNLYISMSNYNYYRALPVNTTDSNSKKVKVSSIRPMENQATTDVYKFSLNNSQVTYINKGAVPGTILNQFSMDENDGYFRIATTAGEVWSGNTKNNVYILDDILNIKGKLEDIAPGEKIYSTRFMGDRCYMVTFKKVDPLFVIDLKNPQEPKILGALKIPGYSDYLHPYDENHIIGFGKDTEAYGETAFYQGMKLAIFDVTDVSKPVEMYKEIIGDRGTDSELLRNHKALLFSKEKNLLAFPVSVFEVKDKSLFKDENEKITEYGAFTFQGAYVYNIDLEKGFSLKGKITHISNQEMLKSGYSGYEGDSDINRILYIGDTLYTLSNNIIKANNLQDLKEKNSLDVK